MNFEFKCPYCGQEYDGLDYAYGEDMEGDFRMNCEDGCKI